MLPRPERSGALCTWDNGQKAVVHLLKAPNGEEVIQKLYKPGFNKWMFREFLSLYWISKRLDVVPKLISFRPRKREIVMSCVPGQRVLEWVLQQFGEDGLCLEEFLNFEAMDTDPRILAAFQSFKESRLEKATRLKNAIRMSYKKLHSIGWQHGTSDPRNVIYNERHAYIIDFDHARPSLAPGRIDYQALGQWFGVYPE